MGEARDEGQRAEDGVAQSISFVLFVLVDIAYIVIAATYIDSCPKGQMIPIYNIVSGVVNITTTFIECYATMCAKACLRCWNILCKALEGIWLAAGLYCTIQIFPPDYINEASAEYCHQVFYTFSFVTVTVSSVAYVILLCLEICAKCRGRREPEAVPTEPEPDPGVAITLIEPPRSSHRASTVASPAATGNTSHRKHRPRPLKLRHRFARSSICRPQSLPAPPRAGTDFVC
ncbi:uncharacterized protein LOC132396989 isoform X2 [Hypanus sabinus]|uniref:uncharacterized protein LOC132396989 isoform X2 n=1 Tax=Hypanus sabinus TaxID=79690 RepID=UPI0028C41774|nr:uncharacterized protein LOC132396989 isoform X2 [Hypanus sabinus]